MLEFIDDKETVETESIIGVDSTIKYCFSCFQFFLKPYYNITLIGLACTLSQEFWAPIRSSGFALYFPQIHPFRAYLPAF